MTFAKQNLKIIEYIMNDLTQTYLSERENMIQHGSKYGWIDVESIVQDSFLTAVEKKKDSPSYVWGIFKNKLKTAVRSDVRNKSKLNRFKNHCEIHSQNSGDIEHDFSHIELTKRESDLLGLLVNGLSSKQISVRMSLPVGTVYTRINRLRNKIKGQLNG